MGFMRDIAIILISTKLFGLLSRKFQMPQVVGALIAGIVIGPNVLGLVNKSELITNVASLGVIVLMFAAGLETDIEELKKCGKASFIIAIAGVLLPLLGGFGLAIFFNNNGSPLQMDMKNLLENIFIGVILTATSVSITVETLQELGKLKTASGTAILGAAVIDDILGIIILAIVSGIADSTVSISKVLLKILGFFVLAAIVGFAVYYLFKILSNKCGNKRRIPIFAFSFSLIMAFVAEHFFGVADITGAYVAGLALSSVSSSHYIKERMEVLSYLLLSPVFFANVGITSKMEGLNMTMIIFTLLLLIISIVTKVWGCEIGARVCHYSKIEARQIGVGMISRGEVALIVANIGTSLGILSSEYFAPVIVVIIVTTLITPILLKIVYKDKSKELA